MRKIPALLRFYGLDSACVILLQHDTGSTRRIYQRQASAIPLQVAQRIDELRLLHSQIFGNGCYIFICQAHISLPAATGTAALAGVNDWRRVRHGMRSEVNEFPKAFALPW